MRSIDQAQRFLVTSHDAFQYFGAAFGWKMQAIQGLSTEDEAGVGDIQSTVDFVIENEIPVLFVESSIPPDTIDAVIEAVAAQGMDVRASAFASSSAMRWAKPTVSAARISGMLAQNALTIMQSYQCMGVDVRIPEWPVDLLPTPPDELWNVDCAVRE